MAVGVDSINGINTAEAIEHGNNFRKLFSRIKRGLLIENDASSAVSAYKEARSYLDNLNGATVVPNLDEVNSFGILKNTFLGKLCPSLAKADKSMLDLKSCRDMVKTLFGTELKQVENGKYIASGASTAGKFMSHTLAGMNNINLGIATAFEVPDLVASVQNGDFGKQTVRSTAKVVAPSLLASMAANFVYHAAPKPIKTAAAVASAIGAGTLSSKGVNYLADKTLGESIKTQKEKAIAKLQENKADNTGTKEVL